MIPILVALEPWATVQVVRFESSEVRLDLICVFHTFEIEGPLLIRLTKPSHHLALDDAIPFNLRSGPIDGALKRVASWLEVSAMDALAGKQTGFERLERMGARSSKPHTWDESYRSYDI